MRPRVGLGLGESHIRVLVLKRGTVVWAAEAPRTERESLVDTIEGALRGIPGLGSRKPTVTAAVGPCGSQIKQLTGLPAIDDPRTLDALVREGASTFFLRNGTPLTTAAVTDDHRGVWAAAIEEPYVAAAEEACNRLKWNLERVVPTAVVLGFGTTDRQVTWSDGSVQWNLEYGSGTLERARRKWLPDPPPTPPIRLLPVPELYGLGERAGHFADAYGAARLPERAPLTIDPEVLRTTPLKVVLRSLLVPLVLTVAAVAALLLTPLAQTRKAAHASSALEELRASPGWSTAASGKERLATVTTILDEMSAFSSTRSRHTQWLAALTDHLPEGSAVLQLTMDETQGELTALAVVGTDLIEVIDGLPGTKNTELAGQVVREETGTGGLDRVTLTFEIGNVLDTSSTASDSLETIGGR